MKKLLLLLLLLLGLALIACGLVFAASAQPEDNRTVLSTSTENGVTTTLYVGRVQTDPAKDGTATLTIYPDRVLTDSAGNVLASGFGPPFTVTLTAQQYAGISGIITTAYAAQQNPPASP